MLKCLLGTWNFLASSVRALRQVPCPRRINRCAARSEYLYPQPVEPVVHPFSCVSLTCSTASAVPAYVAVCGVFGVVNVAFFPCRVILRHEESVEVEEARFNRRARHLLEAQLHEFSADFVEELQVRMLLAGPSLSYRRLNVVFLKLRACAICP